MGIPTLFFEISICIYVQYSTGDIYLERNLTLGLYV
jgi:hypothetical protein